MLLSIRTDDVLTVQVKRLRRFRFDSISPWHTAIRALHVDYIHLEGLLHDFSGYYKSRVN